MVKNLKLITLFLTLVISIFSVNAQTVLGTAKTEGFQVANSSFDDWSGAAYDGNEMPAVWNVANVTQVGMKFPVIDKVEGRTGNAVKMRETKVGAMGIFEVSPSWITLGMPWTELPSITEVKKATAGT